VHGRALHASHRHRRQCQCFDQEHQALTSAWLTLMPAKSSRCSSTVK
jgi:hypothetical protein